MHRLKQTAARLTSFIIASLLLTGAGCSDLADHSLTGNLWSPESANHCGPLLTNVDLHVFEKSDHSDFLVQYNEEREKNGAVRRRSYFLLENDPSVERFGKPRFVDPKAAQNLQPIPVRLDTSATNLCPGLSATVSTNGTSFFLFRDGKYLGEYRLPAYVETASRTRQILLTPLAVTGDVVIAATVVGVIAGLIYLRSMAGSPSH